jgi:hypothetical protein
MVEKKKISALAWNQIHNLFTIVAGLPDYKVSPLIYIYCFFRTGTLLLRQPFHSSPLFSFPILHCSIKDISFILRVEKINEKTCNYSKLRSLIF